MVLRTIFTRLVEDLATRLPGFVAWQNVLWVPELVWLKNLTSHVIQVAHGGSSFSDFKGNTTHETLIVQVGIFYRLRSNYLNDILWQTLRDPTTSLATITETVKDFLDGNFLRGHILSQPLRIVGRSRLLSNPRYSGVHLIILTFQGGYITERENSSPVSQSSAETESARSERSIFSTSSQSSKLSSSSSSECSSSSSELSSSSSEESSSSSSGASSASSEALGDELTVNGTFIPFGGGYTVTGGMSVAYGKASCYTVSGTITLELTEALEVGKTYRLLYTILPGLKFNNSTVQVRLGNNYDTLRTAIGSYASDITITDLGDGALHCSVSVGYGGPTIELDDFSLREIL